MQQSKVVTQHLTKNLRTRYTNKFHIQAHVVKSNELDVVTDDNISADVLLDSGQLPDFDEYDHSTYNLTLMQHVLRKFAVGLMKNFDIVSSMHDTMETTDTIVQQCTTHAPNLCLRKLEHDVALTSALGIINASSATSTVDGCQFRVVMGNLSVQNDTRHLNLPCPVMLCESTDMPSNITRRIEVILIRPNARHVLVSQANQASQTSQLSQLSQMHPPPQLKSWSSVYITPQKCRLIFGTHLGPRMPKTQALSQGDTQAYHEEHLNNLRSLFGGNKHVTCKIENIKPLIICTSTIKTLQSEGDSNVFDMHTIFFEMDMFNGFLFTQ